MFRPYLLISIITTSTIIPLCNGNAFETSYSLNGTAVFSAKEPQSYLKVVGQKLLCTKNGKILVLYPTPQTHKHFLSPPASDINGALVPLEVSLPTPSNAIEINVNELSKQMNPEKKNGLLQERRGTALFVDTYIQFRSRKTSGSGTYLFEDQSGQISNAQGHELQDLSLTVLDTSDSLSPDTSRLNQLEFGRNENYAFRIPLPGPIRSWPSNPLRQLQLKMVGINSQKPGWKDSSALIAQEANIQINYNFTLAADLPESMIDYQDRIISIALTRAFAEKEPGHSELLALWQIKADELLDADYVIAVAEDRTTPVSIIGLIPTTRVRTLN